ncbi:hypothetical protein Anas_07339 [Armadillidium nasatum]|uniref:Uncharacterized protein n=1 Tax=Armadillidium nasatum TaxID=96803 RepID=A0A5N5SMD5_9CRUS|nr:hypothetical protein Anas_07339 [Armadillidium nasatum]
MSRSCSTWVAVGDVVSTSQLPSPQARLGGSDSPAITAVDFIQSVNKKPELSLLSPLPSSSCAPKEVLSMIRREVELPPSCPAASVNPSSTSSLTARDVERERGRQLNKVRAEYDNI